MATQKTAGETAIVRILDREEVRNIVNRMRECDRILEMVSEEAIHSLESCDRLFVDDGTTMLKLEAFDAANEAAKIAFDYVRSAIKEAIGAVYYDLAGLYRTSFSSCAEDLLADAMSDKLLELGFANADGYPLTVYPLRGGDCRYACSVKIDAHAPIIVTFNV